MVGRDHQLPHTLVPLELAVTIVRSKIANGGSPVAADPNAMATFIAATVPIWEYSDDPSTLARPLRNAAGSGVFRKGGRELHFLDGRPAKRLLAVQADDINCVIEMLQHPDDASLIRNRVLRTLARKLVQQSREAGAKSTVLRGNSRTIFDRAETLGARVSQSG